MSTLTKCCCCCCKRNKRRHIFEWEKDLPPYTFLYLRRQPWSRSVIKRQQLQQLVDKMVHDRRSKTGDGTRELSVRTNRGYKRVDEVTLKIGAAYMDKKNTKSSESEHVFQYPGTGTDRLRRFIFGKSSIRTRSLSASSVDPSRRYYRVQETDLDKAYKTKGNGEGKKRMRIDITSQTCMEFEAAEDAKIQKVNKSLASRGVPKPMEGQILKFTNVMKGFQYRYFVLDPDAGILEYFEKEEHKKQRPRGSVHLAAAVVSPSEEDSQTFIVSASNGEIFKLRASDARERQLWVDRIRSTAEYHTANMAQISPTSTLKPVSNLTTVWRKESLRRARGSHESLPTMKKSPRGDAFQEVKEYYMEADDYAKHLDDRISALPSTGHYMNSLDTDLLLLKATSAATLQCIQDCIAILQLAEPGRMGIDARVIDKIDPTTALRISGGIIDQSETLPAPEDEVPDVETYEDTDLEGVDDHKSVILHLLSQLKLGMDLTKVVLPTFILERRSLLEMFADCMAHPDAFLKIADVPDPEGRMLAVLEWYLTSFHNGRQGSIAKKPYNPIIGETFHCSWRLRNNPSGDRDMTYTAEQVSHHPPVSAFYFECPHKKMKMNASIYTKSKFMGMSIGVSMIGKAHLRLEEFDEDYVFTLPSAYARSILTVPWVELGDKVSLVCEKTGYSANIVFHTKPFYGGKLHHVTAEAKNVKTGDIICKVNGEWNARMEFTYSDGSSKVIDVTTLPVYCKSVRPIEKQNDFESRKLWQHVTKALKFNDVSTATEHKKMLEEIQREGERHRKDLNVEYSAKHFKKVNGVWIFKSLPDDFVQP